MAYMKGVMTIKPVGLSIVFRLCRYFIHQNNRLKCRPKFINTEILNNEKRQPVGQSVNHPFRGSR